MTEPEAAGGAARGILAADTSPWAEHLQVEAWRRMSPAEKARLVTGMTQAVRELALAGLRQRHPGASERELFLRFAVLTLGRARLPRLSGRPGLRAVMSAGRPDPIEIAVQVARALERCGVLYAVGGSIASSFSGEPRSTLYVDIVVALDESHIDALLVALGDGFYADAGF